MTNTYENGKIADELPADERGVSRSSVWASPGDTGGDYAVGREFEVMYSVGDTRLEEIYFIEDIRLLRGLDPDDPEWADWDVEAEPPYTVMEMTRVWTISGLDEDGAEISNDDDDMEYEIAYPYGVRTLEGAETIAGNMAIVDRRWQICV